MIQFGTSGWRGVIGREVTFRNVRLITRALCDTLAADGSEINAIVIGYDTRMLSEKFARAAAELIASEDVPAALTGRDTASPVVASAVLERGAAAGMVFTGSHNPPEYNGVKIFTADGILASTEMTDRIEARVTELGTDFDDT
ncbi:MAG: phosphoglucomutase/phosphomannomutase family protein, partial [Holophagae bacterium]